MTVSPHPYDAPSLSLLISLGRGVLVVVLLLGLVNLLLDVGQLLLSLLVLDALHGVQRKRTGHVEAPLDGGSLKQPLEPAVDVGELGLERHTQGDRGVDPADEGDVGDGVFAADNVFLIREVGVQHAVEPLRLAHVALYAVGDGLLGGAGKVVGLPLHGPHAAVLPPDPGLCAGVVVRVGGEGEAVVRVVAAGEVGEDGAALEDVEAVVVVVDDGRDAAVGVGRGGEPGLLLDVCADVDGVGGVGQAVEVFELLEEDAGLPAVGCAYVERWLATGDFMMR